MYVFVKLKIVAMASMLSDHLGSVLDLHEGFHCFGRIAFPLYAFMIIESFRHLAEKPDRMRKFMIALAVMAVISEPAYDRAFFGTWFYLESQNQLLQFLTYGLAFGERCG